MVVFVGRRNNDHLSWVSIGLRLCFGVGSCLLVVKQTSDVVFFEPGSHREVVLLEERFETFRDCQVKSKVVRKFLQAAVKLRPDFRVSMEFCISLDRS